MIIQYRIKQISIFGMNNSIYKIVKYTVNRQNGISLANARWDKAALFKTLNTFRKKFGSDFKISKSLFTCAARFKLILRRKMFCAPEQNRVRCKVSLPNFSLFTFFFFVQLLLSAAPTLFPSPYTNALSRTAWASKLVI